MTKQELYDGLIAKFALVTPIAEWRPMGEVLGVKRYSVTVFDENNGEMKEFTVYVQNEGEVNESAIFGREDPLAPEPPAEYDFYTEMIAKLNELVANNTITGYLQEKVGSRYATIEVYRDVAGTITKFIYFVWADDNDVIQYQEIGG